MDNQVMENHVISATGKATDSQMHPPQLDVFTLYQKTVVAILAFLQFTIILDFMILSPLGAFLMPSLHLSPAQFGMVVSGYAFGAGAAGLLTAGFADRFDRKSLLMIFYCGFIVGTLGCALAPNYGFLLAARIITGIFGGVIGSTVFAITTDLFPYSMRGRVMGIIQTAFAASQVMGIPIGLYLSNHWGWHTPFLMIAGVAMFVGLLIWFYLKPVNEHLKVPSVHNPIRHLFDTLVEPAHLHAFAATILLSTGGFMLMPFASNFTVHNLGIDLEHLPLVYLITGLCSIIVGPFIGRLSDLFGKFKMFLFGSILTIIMIAIYTHLGISRLLIVIVVNVALFIGISSRMISSQALISAIPKPAHRGSFMAVNSSLQQFSGGLAAAIAGVIVLQHPNGSLEHFDTLGYMDVLHSPQATRSAHLISELRTPSEVFFSSGGFRVTSS